LGDANSGHAEQFDGEPGEHLKPMFRALAERDAYLDDAEREVVDRYLRRATAASAACSREGSLGFSDAPVRVFDPGHDRR